MPICQVQTVCRGWFERFGLPHHCRVDNGYPWATWSDLPPALALWWIGLGIDPIWNHAHTPKENAFVERCNGLVDHWAEPGQCTDFAAWQQKLYWMVTTQREAYPSKQGRSRLEAYPGLMTNPRSYRADQETEHFDLERVKRYLAQGRWPRVVSKIGQITFYGKAYRVGRAYVRQQVWLSFDAVASQWVVQAQEGAEIVRHEAQQITQQRICALQVANPRPPSKRRTGRT